MKYINPATTLMNRVIQELSIIIAWSPIALGILSGRYTDAAKYSQESRADLFGAYYADRITNRDIQRGTSHFCPAGSTSTAILFNRRTYTRIQFIPLCLESFIVAACNTIDDNYNVLISE